MGCDFDIQIQVMYGSTWVPIIYFEWTTRGGGIPLCDAVVRAKKLNGVDGNHGRHQSRIIFDNDRINAMRFHVSNEHSKCCLTKQSSKVIAGGLIEEKITADPKNKPKEYDYIERDCWLSSPFVYYSLQDFLKYVANVKDVEMEYSIKYRSIFEVLGKTPYSSGLQTVVTWMKMALTAGPANRMFDRFGMFDQKLPRVDDKTDKTTRILHEAQSALCAVHVRFMSQFKSKFRLPGQIW